MRHELIHLNGFMYAVDRQDDFTEGVLFYDKGFPQLGIQRYRWDALPCNDQYKIIATNDPSLNLPLLPVVEEDGEWREMKTAPKDGSYILIVEQISNDYNIHKAAWMIDADVTGKGDKAWCIADTYGDEQGYYYTVDNALGWLPLPDPMYGYKTSSAKQFTEEDMLRLAIHCWNIASRPIAGKVYNVNEVVKDYIQSLKPKPVAVELEMELVDDNDFSQHEEGGTHPGNTVSEYVLAVDENNYVKVKQWYHESN